MVEWNVSFDKSNLQELTLEQVEEKFKAGNFFNKITNASLFIMLSSVPIWIFFGWNYCWKTFLSAYFFYLIFGFFNKGMKEAKKAYINELEKQGKLIK